MHKKRTFFFDGGFDAESITSLIESIEECEETEVWIYMKSDGGSVSPAKVLMDFFQHSEKKITLIAVGSINSVALEVFLFSKNIEKRILPGCFAIAHFIGARFDTRELIANPTDIGQREGIRENNQTLLRKLKNAGLTETELQELEKSTKLFIEHERLKALI